MQIDREKRENHVQSLPPSPRPLFLKTSSAPSRRSKSNHVEHSPVRLTGTECSVSVFCCPHATCPVPPLGSATWKIDEREAPSTRAVLGEAFHNCCFCPVQANYTIRCVSSYLLPLIAAGGPRCPSRAPGDREGEAGSPGALLGPSGNPVRRINFPVTTGLITAKGTQVFVVNEGFPRTDR